MLAFLPTRLEQAKLMPHATVVACLTQVSWYHV